MEKKIYHDEKDVKRVEENPASKPCGCGRKCAQNASHSAPLALHVEDEIDMQMSAKLTLQKRKAFVYSKTKLSIQEIPEQDVIREDEEIPEEQTIIMKKSTKFRVTRKSTGTPPQNPQSK